MANDHVLAGCNFDATTASAVHGSKVLAFVASKNSENLYGISGQTGLSFSLEVETSQTSTKDNAGGWSVKFPGVKSWSASVEGLYIYEDEGRKAIMKAIETGSFLCFGIYAYENTDTGTKYTCIRKGLVIPSSDSIDAPSDDNTTFSMNFEGTGKPYLVETASEEDRKKYDFTDNGEMALQAEALG